MFKYDALHLDDETIDRAVNEMTVEQPEVGLANVRVSRHIEQIADRYEASIDRTEWWY